MNSDVEIHVGQARQVLAVPSAALRTQRDVASAAQVLGLDPQAVQAEIRPAGDARLGHGRGGATGRSGQGGANRGTRGRSPVGGDSARRRSAGQSDTSAARQTRRRALDALTGGRWIVFVQRGGKPTPTWVQTGLTDLDYSEVLSGLTLGDSVYILPSASLVQSQQQFRQRITNMTGGGLPGVRQQGAGGTGTGGAGTGAGSRQRQ